MEFVWVWWVVVGGVVGYAIGAVKDRPVMATLLGVVFGPIGWLISLIDGTKYACPECASDVRKDARRCPQCRTSLL